MGGSFQEQETDSSPARCLFSLMTIGACAQPFRIYCLFARPPNSLLPWSTGPGAAHLPPPVWASTCFPPLRCPLQFRGLSRPKYTEHCEITQDKPNKTCTQNDKKAMPPLRDCTT